MIVHKPINKPRWFGLTGIGGTTPVDPSTLPNGDKVIPGYGIQGSDIQGFNPQNYDAGIYLIEPRNDNYKDLITPDNPNGFAYNMGEVTSYNKMMIMQRLINQGGTVSDEAVNSAFISEIFWQGTPLTKGGGSPLKSGQFFICPCAKISETIYSNKLLSTDHSNNGNILTRNPPAPPYTSEPYYQGGFYAVQTNEYLGTVEPNTIKSFNKLNIGDTNTSTLLNAALFSFYSKDSNGELIDLTSYLNVNYSDLGIDVDFAPTAYPNIGYAIGSTGVRNVSWNLPFSQYGTETTHYWKQAIWSENGFSVYKLMYDNRPATYAESLPFRCGGVVTGLQGWSSGWFGLYSTLIFGA